MNKIWLVLYKDEYPYIESIHTTEIAALNILGDYIIERNKKYEEIVKNHNLINYNTEFYKKHSPLELAIGEGYNSYEIKEVDLSQGDYYLDI